MPRVIVRPDLSSYVVVMIVAFAVTVMTVPLFRVLAVARGLVVEPDERRAHERPTATLGGGAMFLGFAAGFGLAWYSGWFPGLFGNSTEPFGVLAAATLAYVVGVTDDIREISAPAKTAGLVLVSVARPRYQNIFGSGCRSSISSSSPPTSATC
ncbi:MAG: hypothetical protein R2710_16730 [Acidimicrobiales bacterium]